MTESLHSLSFIPFLDISPVQTAMGGKQCASLPTTHLRFPLFFFHPNIRPPLLLTFHHLPLQPSTFFPVFQALGVKA